jgi:hypothetical protein
VELVGYSLAGGVGDRRPGEVRTGPVNDGRAAESSERGGHSSSNMPGSVNDMLAEARGLRLSMMLAHQYMAQLPRELQFAVSSSARTKVYFSVSPEDARLLARHVGPHVSEHDLSWLDDYTATCRLQANGRALPAFTLETEPPAPVIGKADQIRRRASACHPGWGTSIRHASAA